jgi:hypothetical protein
MKTLEIVLRPLHISCTPSLSNDLDCCVPAWPKFVFFRFSFCSRPRRFYWIFAGIIGCGILPRLCGTPALTLLPLLCLRLWGVDRLDETMAKEKPVSLSIWPKAKDRTKSVKDLLLFRFAL